MKALRIDVGHARLMRQILQFIAFAKRRRLSPINVPAPQQPQWTRRAVIGAVPAIVTLSGQARAAHGDVRPVLERYAAAWTRGDLKGIADCYHERFTLHYFGNNALSGEHVGKARALDVLRQFSVRTRRKLLVISAVLAGPERGALIARERLMKGDQPVEVERLLVYRVDDGLLAECWIYDQDQRLIDAIVG